MDGSIEAALLRAAHKELAYLEQFGQLITHPQEPSPLSFPHTPSRPVTEQYLCFEVVRLWMASRRPARLETHLDPTPISPRRYSGSPAELQ